MRYALLNGFSFQFRFSPQRMRLYGIAMLLSETFTGRPLAEIQNESYQSVPGSILDLKAWKLTLPVTTSGADGADKIAAEVKQPDLDNYSINPWFRDTLFNTTKTVLFRAHANGAKTSSNTKFARSELREMTVVPYASAAWKFKDGKTHTMIITEAITALPFARAQVSAGQIHDADNDVFMLKCEGKNPGTVSDKARLVGYLDNAKKSFLIEENYVLGQFFTLQVEVSTAGGITVFFNGKVTPIVGYSDFPTIKAAGNIDLSGMYFKAGCYIQSNVVDYQEKPDAYAEVAISALSLTHGTPVSRFKTTTKPSSIHALVQNPRHTIDFLGRYRPFYFPLQNSVDLGSSIQIEERRFP